MDSTSTAPTLITAAATSSSSSDATGVTTLQCPWRCHCATPSHYFGKIDEAWARDHPVTIDGLYARMLGMISCRHCGWYRIITDRDDLNKVYYQPEVQRDLQLASLAGIGEARSREPRRPRIF